jgi:virulence factor Mce-like protein
VQKRAPTLGNLLVISLFALSCFGLLLFLWESFGGAVPLKPKGYRVTVAFPRALALAEQSDVRISGVEVGHVISVKRGAEGRTIATLEIAGSYAPLRANMHAILRQKTLLGETYVQLIPEGQTGPYLRDETQLADDQVEPSVTLDDILSTFDPKTRRAFETWQQAVAEGINGKGEAINSDFAALEPFVEHTNKLVSLLAPQQGAVTDLVRATGEVFGALAGRDHQLEGLISNGEHTFHAAAEGSRAFAEAFKALPTFEKSSRTALKELDSFANDASPLLDQLRPTERELAKLLTAAKPFAPKFDAFLTSLGPLTTASKTGLPAVAKELGLTVPLLENLVPVLHNFDPFLEYADAYVPEIQAFFANLTAATEGHQNNANTEGKGPLLHYLKAMQVFRPESLSVYTEPVGTNRSNPYPKPHSSASIAAGAQQVFSSKSCANSAPSASGPGNEIISEELIKSLIEFKVVNSPESANQVAAPACTQQSPFTFNGQTGQFPHVTYTGK